MVTRYVTNSGIVIYTKITIPFIKSVLKYNRCIRGESEETKWKS